MSERGGTIRWFASNPVAANLVMLLLLVGGLFSTCTIKQEVFPEFRLGMVRVVVPYPGASPEEVEKGIVLAVEESVRGLDGVDRVTGAATEGAGHVYVTLELEADSTTVLADVKNAVDRLTSLPQDAERPMVSLVNNKFEVTSVILHGDVDVRQLRLLSEQVRDELVADPGITTAELVGAPAHQLSIEIPQAQLRTHGLTLEQVAAKIRATSVELAGGSVKTEGGEILLRTAERRYGAEAFESLPILTGTTGTELTLGQIADVREVFEETDEYAYWGNEPAMMIKVFRTGNQTPLEVSAVVQMHLDRLATELPPGVSVNTWLDWSELYQQRIDLLLRNAAIGLVLVLIILGLFLELRLAFWVTMGIPVSFLGAVLFMPTLDVTVNMISLFAFIVVLGMVVDDAIVVGENIYELRQRGVPPLKAAIKGAQDVGTPVCFAIATSVASFMPMAFVPGVSGKMYRVIPAIVVSVLLISLVESLWVLPAHLAALKDPKATGLYAAVYRQQQKVRRGLERFIEGIYGPTLGTALRWRYTSFAIGVAMLFAAGGFVAGGHIPFRFMPDIAGDVTIADVQMPFGTPRAETERVRQQMLQVAQDILDENGEEGIVRGVFSQVGTPLPGDPGQAMVPVTGSHLANVQVFFVDAGERRLQSQAFLDEWRKRLGNIAGVEKLSFSSALGPSPGAPVNVELQHDDMDVLDEASQVLAEKLRAFPEVYDVDDGFSLGKSQLQLTMTPEGTGLGLATADVARQVRASFYGAEALRQQEGRNEVRVLVRLPERERQSVYDVETLMLRTPAGGEIPLQEAADIDSGRSRPTILRAEGRRMVPVTAKVRADTSPDAILGALKTGALPELQEQFPGLTYDFGGAAREQAKSMGSLSRGGM
ncbi:MAG: efflux RND transporter permease subunit, partial [Myxococcota bacterium]